MAAPIADAPDLIRKYAQGDAPPAPPPWTQAEEDQLTALTARKLLVDTHRRQAVLTVVEEFHHRNITTDEVTAELISLAPRVIKALLPYAAEYKLPQKEELMWAELIAHIEDGLSKQARQAAVVLRDLSRSRQ